MFSVLQQISCCVDDIRGVVWLRCLNLILLNVTTSHNKYTHTQFGREKAEMRKSQGEREDLSLH